MSAAPPDAAPGPHGTAIHELAPADRQAVVAFGAELHAIERVLRPSWAAPDQIAGASVGRLYDRLVDPDERGAAFVAVSGGQVVALATAFLAEDPLEQEPELAYIDALVVARRHRRRGIGRTPVARCGEWTAAHGVGRVIVEVLEPNHEALAAYQALGFAPASRILEIEV